MTDDKKKILYDNLTEDGYELDSFEEFSDQLRDEQVVETLYNNLVSDGYDMESIQQFKADIGYGAEEPEQQPVKPAYDYRPIPAQQTAPAYSAPSAKRYQQAQGTTATYTPGAGAVTPSASRTKAEVNKARKQQREEYGIPERKPLTDQEALAQMTGQQQKDVTSRLDALSKPQSPKQPEVGAPSYYETHQAEHQKLPTMQENLDDLRKQADELRRKLKPVYDGESIPLSEEQLAELERREGWQAAEKARQDMVRVQADRAAQHQTRTALHKVQESIKKVEREVSNSNFAQTLWTDLKDPNTWAYGIPETLDAIELQKLKAKLDKGEELTPDEQELVNKTIQANAYAQLSDDTGWQKAADVTAFMLPFVAEFMVGGQILGAPGMAGAKLAAKMSSKIVGEGAGKTALRVVTKATGWTAAEAGVALAYANTSGAGRTAADVMSRNQGQLTTDLGGNPVFIDDVGLGEAIVKGEVANMLEYMTEAMGPIISKGGSAARKGISKGADWLGGKIAMGATKAMPKFTAGVSGMMSKMSSSQIASFSRSVAGKVSQFAKSDVAQAGSFMLERVGVSGIPEEIMEEEANMLLNACFVGDNKFSDLVDPQVQGDLALSMIMSVATLGLGGMVGGAAQVRQWHKYRDQKDMADAAGGAVFGENWTRIKDIIDNADNKDIADVLFGNKDKGIRGIMDEFVANDTEGLAIADYVRSTMMERGHSIRAMKEAEEQSNKELTAEQKKQLAMGEAYQRGRNADEQTRMDIATEFAMSDASDEDYEIKAEAYKGVQDEIEHQAVRNAASKRTELRNRVGVDEHTIQPVILKSKTEDGRSKEVYLIEGDVQLLGGGAVDTETSDDMLIVYDIMTGEATTISPADIEGMGAPTTLEAEEAIIEQQRQEEVQGQLDVVRGKVSVTPGEPFTMPNGQSGQVVAVDGDNVVVDIEGQQASVSLSEMQRTADQQRVDEYVSRNGEAPTAEEEAQQAAVEQSEEVISGVPNTNDAGDVLVRGVPDEYQPQMEVVITDKEDGQTKPAIIVIPRAKYTMDGDVEDPEGARIVYIVDGDQRSDLIEDFDDMVQGYYTTPTATEQSLADTSAEQTVEEPEEDAAEPQSEAMPMQKDGSPDFYATTPDIGHKWLFGTFGAETGNVFLGNYIAETNKTLAELTSKKPDPAKFGTNIAKYQQALTKWQSDMDAAQAAVNYWGAVKGIQDAIEAAEAANNAEVAQNAPNTAGEEVKQTWESANKVYGNTDEVILADGSTINGKYVLVESGAATPSHNPSNGYAKRAGFPVNSTGETANDRDYERDKDAQHITELAGASYDGRALQNVPIVSGEGVVLSGNGRTMAGEIAAQNGTDTAYIESLKRNPGKFGFTSEQVGAMKHPRVVFEAEGNIPYTTDTFAKFNQQETKTQSKTEQAVKLGKQVSDDLYKRIVSIMNGYDSIAEFYADKETAGSVIGMLVSEGIISKEDVAKMTDGEGVSAAGKEFIENILIGKAFESRPDTIRELQAYPGMRRKVIRALHDISYNATLDTYNLTEELSDAIHLAYTARNEGYKEGDKVSEFADQQSLFPTEVEGEADFQNLCVRVLADIMNGKREKDLKSVFATYNSDAGNAEHGQVDMFSGEVRSKEQILEDVTNYLYGTSKSNKTEEQRPEGPAAEQEVEQPQAAAEPAETTNADKGGTEAERGQVSGRRGDKQIKRAVKNLSEAETAFDKANAIAFFDSAVYAGAEATEEEKALFGQAKADLAKEGYEVVDMLGKPYHDGMRVTATFIGDENLAPGETVITMVNKPQVNKDGVMVQAADIVVRHGPRIEDAPTVPKKRVVFDTKSNTWKGLPDGVDAYVTEPDKYGRLYSYTSEPGVTLVHYGRGADIARVNVSRYEYGESNAPLLDEIEKDGYEIYDEGGLDYVKFETFEDALDFYDRLEEYQNRARISDLSDKARRAWDNLADLSERHQAEIELGIENKETEKALNSASNRHSELSRQLREAGSKEIVMGRQVSRENIDRIKSELGNPTNEKDTTQKNKTDGGKLTDKEAAMRDGLVEVMRRAGVDVVTDEAEGQRMLDMAGRTEANAEDIRTMKESVTQGQPMFFRTEGGDVYGYTMDGKIYIDPRIATAETPIHEYTHLWAAALRKANPKAWAQLKKLMAKETDMMDYVKRKYPELADNEDALMDEVFAHYSGKRGKERMDAEIDEAEGVIEKAKVVVVFEKIKAALDMFWNMARDLFAGSVKGSGKMKAEDFADMAMNDLLNKFVPAKSNGLSAAEQKTLMGAHNISEEKLRKALRNGGLANPSMAVVDTRRGIHSQFGEITLIPHSSMIDKSTGRNAGTWMADAWTPSYPHVTKVSSKGTEKALKEVREEWVKSDENKEMAEKMIGYAEGMAYQDYEEPPLEYQFLKETGRNPKVIAAKTKYDKELADFAKNLSEETGVPVPELLHQHYDKIVDFFIGREKKKLEDAGSEGMSEFAKNLAKKRTDRDYWDIDKIYNPFLNAYRASMKAEGGIDVDGTIYDAMSRVQSDKELRAEYKKWLDNLGKRLGLEEKIFVGYTPSGRRKYVDNTLENVSKIMNKEGQAGATGWGDPGAFIAKVVGKANTTEKIRKERNRLVGMDFADKHTKAKEEFASMFEKVASQLMGSNLYSFGVGDARLNELADVKGDVRSYAKREWGIELSNEWLNDYNNLVDYARNNYPVLYFETKFNRPVYINEFAAAVVPNGTSEEVVNGLKENGIPVAYYDTKKEGDRERAVLEAAKSKEGVMFQKVSYNSGYTERENGDKLSIRASIAEGNGRYTEGRFRTNYKVSRYAFDVLVELGFVNSDEWHHTGANYKESKYYRWMDDDISDYSDGDVVEGSLGSLYIKNKSEIDKLAKSVSSLSWEYEDREAEKKVLPLDVYVKLNTNENDILNDAEQAEKRREHEDISNAGERIGTPYVRMLRHQSVDEKYRAIVNERAKELLRDKYDTYVAETEEYNKKIHETNRSIDERNALSSGRETVLIHIAELMGEDHESAVAKIEIVSKFGRERERIEEYNAEYEKLNDAINEIIKEANNKQSEYAEKCIANGKARFVTRSRENEVSDMFVENKREMNGRYGWFDANSRYDLPIYVSGIEFGDKRSYNHYKKILSDAEDTARKMRKEFADNEGEVRLRESANAPASSYEERLARSMRSGYTREQYDSMVAREFENMRGAAERLVAALNMEGNVDFVVSNEGLRGQFKTAKGWYDESTGRITIVLQNNTSVEDITKTIFHECVAHYGLRELFGDNFDNFLDNVYNNAEPDTRKAIDKMRGESRRERTEEYMARLAEDENYGANNGFWDHVKMWFLGMLKSIGIAGTDLEGHITDGELKYILWRSYENMAEPGRYNNVFGGKDATMRDRYSIDKRVSNGGVTYIVPNRNTVRSRQTERDAEYMEAVKNGDQMRTAVEELGKKFGTPIRIVGDVNEIEDSNADTQVRKRNSKGWYDVRTGEVVVVLPNNESVEDAVATVAHEVVAHKGLREIVGKENYDAFLDEVYDHLSAELKERVDNAAAKMLYNDLFDNPQRASIERSRRIAVDELFGELAEKNATDFTEGEKTLWQWLKDAVKRAIDKFLGTSKLPGWVELSDNELRYMLWRSSQNLQRGNEGPIDMARDMAKREDLGLDNDEVRYRDGKDVVDSIEYKTYERALKRSWGQTVEAHQDSMYSLKALYNAILKSEGDNRNIEDVEGYENAYLAENRMSSVNEAETHQWTNQYMKPLLEEVRRLIGGRRWNRRERKNKYVELERYMMAKHGLERNEVLARRDAEREAEEKYGKELADAQRALDNDPTDEELQNAVDAVKLKIDEYTEERYYNNRTRDYSGITALTGKDNVVDAELEAQQIVDNYESAHDTKKLWDLVNEATKSSLKKMYDSGMMSRERYESVRDMFEYYIPLQGFDSDVAEDVYAYMGSDGTMGYGTPLRRAEGRRSLADDPIATIQMNGEATIRQGNRNIMKRHFYNFVMNHKSKIVSINEVFLRYNDANNTWEQVYPENINENDRPEDVRKKMEEFVEKMRTLCNEKPDEYKRSRDLPNIPYRTIKESNATQHQVNVSIGGKTVVMTINGNPRAALALNGLTNPNTNPERTAKIVRNASDWLRRNMASVMTTRNPNFVISNFVRDMIFSHGQVFIKENQRYLTKYEKNFAKALWYNWGMFMEWEKGIINERLNDSNRGDNYMRGMFYDFMTNGGETGWTSMRDIEKHKKAIQKDLATGKNLWKDFWRLLDTIGRTVENFARFAAFVTSRESGRSIERSIWDAKEVSVNFNKKGAGDRFLEAKGQTTMGNAGALTGGLGRGLFVFYNAGIQGLDSFGKSFKKSPAKAIGFYSTLFLLGMLVPVLNMLLGKGDGDDEEEGSYYDLPEYTRRQNICINLGNKYLSIPLPIEYRAVYGLGELAIETLSNNGNADALKLTGDIMAQMSQILPIDFMEGQGGLHAFVPTIIKPVVEANQNVGWTGAPIYRDDKYHKYDPKYKLAFTSANKQLTESAKWLNELSGGDNYTKGRIDINPAKLEYELRGYFGGYWTFTDELVKTAETLAGRREFEWRSIPLANRLFKEGDDRMATKKLNDEYWSIAEEFNQTKYRLSAYKKEIDENGEDVAKYIERESELKASDAYKRYLVMYCYKPILDAYWDKIKKSTADSEKQNYTLRQTKLRRSLIDAIHTIEEGGKEALDPSFEGVLDDIMNTEKENKFVNAVENARKKYREASRKYEDVM